MSRDTQNCLDQRRRIFHERCGHNVCQHCNASRELVHIPGVRSMHNAIVIDFPVEFRVILVDGFVTHRSNHKSFPA